MFQRKDRLSPCWEGSFQVLLITQKAINVKWIPSGISVSYVSQHLRRTKLWLPKHQKSKFSRLTDTELNWTRSVQSLSHISLFVTPWTTAHQASLSITNSQSPPKPMSIESVMPSNHLILSSPSPALNLSQHQGLFQRVSSLHQVGKVLKFQLQHLSFQWTPGLISFRMDWLDLLALQGTLKSLLQHHSSKASILLCSAFFIVQLSHPYISTGKTIALTRQTFVDKVMPLLFNMLSRLVITFLPRSKCLLISWLQSPSAVYWTQLKGDLLKNLLLIFYFTILFLYFILMSYS